MRNVPEPTDPNSMHSATDYKDKTVEHFLTNHYKTWGGQTLFHHVHNITNGILEVLVHRNNIIEGQRCIETLLIDIAKNMEHDCIHQGFKKPNQVLALLDDHTPWRPRDLSEYGDADTPPALLTNSHARFMPIKRARTSLGRGGGLRGNASYTTIAKLSTVTSNALHGMKPYIDNNIQNEVQELKKTVSDLTKQLLMVRTDTIGSTARLEKVIEDNRETTNKMIQTTHQLIDSTKQNLQTEFASTTARLENKVDKGFATLT